MRTINNELELEPIAIVAEERLYRQCRALTNTSQFVSIACHPSSMYSVSLKLKLEEIEAD